jgi:chemotaxis protein methyltransferase CheR
MTSTADRAIVDVAQTLERRVGLQLDACERGRLSRCVVAASQARSLEVADFVARLETDSEALQDLLNRVTVQETAFFRDPAQFDALADFVLPALGAPVTVWSAACSNGQEAYSVAMVLHELGHGGSRVIATDISTQALDRTRRAWYSTSEIKGLSPQRRHHFLSKADDGFEIVPELRARVAGGLLNLSTDAPPFPSGSRAVVLCRNVLIYFGPDEIARFIDRLADWLAPGSWLFLGYSESLRGVTDRFELVRLGDAFVYRRVEARMVHRRGSAAPKLKTPRRSVRRPTAAATPGVDVSGLPGIGALASQAGDHAAAITAFRKYAYVNPTEPIAHLHLGLALEASGDLTAAARAYSAARVTLAHGEASTIEANLEGYGIDELTRLLDMKLAGSR